MSSKQSPTNSSISSPDLTRALIALKESTKQLNEVSDRVNEALREVEEFLDQQSIGLPVYINAPSEAQPDNDDGRDVYLCIAYIQAKDKFRLGLSWMELGEEVLRKNWSECNRAQKLMILEHVPAIVNELLGEVKKRIDATEKTVNRVDVAFGPWL